MALIFRSVFLATGIAASGAVAAPVGVFSELTFESTLVVNSGNLIADGAVTISIGTLSQDVFASSTVEAADTVPSQTSNVQVGNPFADPPLPYLASRTDATALQGSPLEGAQGSYDIEMLVLVDQSNLQLLTRRNDNTGSASVLFVDDPINAAGLSFFNNTRVAQIENTADVAVSFDISGFFDVDMSAEVIGAAGVARTQMAYSVFFENAVGALVTYSEPIPYTELITDDDGGVFASLNYEAGDSGLYFTSEVGSDIAGGGGLAAAAAGVGYRFTIALEAGGSVSFIQSRNQRNEAAIRLQDPVPDVPLPASGVLLLAGVLGLGGWRRMRG